MKRILLFITFLLIVLQIFATYPIRDDVEIWGNIMPDSTRTRSIGSSSYRYIQAYIDSIFGNKLDMTSITCGIFTADSARIESLDVGKMISDTIRVVEGNRQMVITKDEVFSYNLAEDSGYYYIYDDGIGFFDYTTQTNNIALLRSGLTLDTFRIYDNVGVICSLTTPSNMEWHRGFGMAGYDISNIGIASGVTALFGLGSFDSLKSVIFAEIDTIRDSVYIPKLKSNSIYATYINSDSVSIDSIFNIEYLTPKNDTLWLPYNNTIAIGGQAGSGDSAWIYMGHNFTSIEDIGWQIQDSFGNKALAKSDLFYIRNITDVSKLNSVNISRHWFAYRTYAVRYPYDGYYYFDIDTSSYMRRLDTFRIVNKDLPDSLSNCRLEYKQGAFTIADTLDSLTYANGDLALTGKITADSASANVVSASNKVITDTIVSSYGDKFFNDGSYWYVSGAGLYNAFASRLYGINYMYKIYNKATIPLLIYYDYVGNDSIELIFYGADTSAVVDSFDQWSFRTSVIMDSNLTVGGDLNIQPNALNTPVLKVVVKDSLTGLTTNAWTTVKFDYLMEGDTAFFEFPAGGTDSTKVVVKKTGHFTLVNRLNAYSTGTLAGSDVEVRVLINGTEANGSQAQSKKDRNSDTRENVFAYSHQDVSAGDTLQMQYYTNDSNMVFKLVGQFDNTFACGMFLMWVW